MCILRTHVPLRLVCTTSPQHRSSFCLTAPIVTVVPHPPFPSWFPFGSTVCTAIASYSNCAFLFWFVVLLCFAFLCPFRFVSFRFGFELGQVLARFADFGGVRLEDDVVVTADGCDNLTVLPRDLEDVEEVLGLVKASREAQQQSASTASNEGEGGGEAATAETK